MVDRSGTEGDLLRPLAALTHALDYRLWPGSALLMHAHSLAWFGALVLAAALFYQRLLGRSITAGLAALLFAVDSAHGTPVGWLANRNSLLAAFFGGLTLLAYDRWRRDQVPAPRVVHPGGSPCRCCWRCSLLARKPASRPPAISSRTPCFWTPRPGGPAFALLPSLGVVIAWRALALALGVGTRGSGMYADPGASPLRFLAAIGQRAPLLLLGQWTPIPAEDQLSSHRAGVPDALGTGGGHSDGARALPAAAAAPRPAGAVLCRRHAAVPAADVRRLPG